MAIEQATAEVYEVVEDVVEGAPVDDSNRSGKPRLMYIKRARISHVAFPFSAEELDAFVASGEHLGMA